MSTYKELYGFRVEVVSSNPSNPLEGEVWYNSTLGQLKGFGGATPPNPNTNKTEEFTPETTAVNVKTLTQS